MFTIIGGDGKEYGPVSAETLREWISGGRANLETRARREGETELKRLGDFSEFRPGSTPPPIGGPGAATNLADRGARLGSWFLDGLVGSIAAAPGLVFMGSSFFAAVARMGGPPGDPQALLREVMSNQRFIAGAIIFAVCMLSLLVIQAVMLSTRGQTIAKSVVKIRIVRVNGEKAGFVHAFLLRAVVAGILGSIPYIGGLFFLVDSCFIFRDDRRCIHDLIAGTKVIKA